MSKFYLQFLAIIFLALGFYYVISSGFYPIAIVNKHWISAKSLKEDALVTGAYYRAILKNSDKNLLREIERATLDKIVENELIYQELFRRLGVSFVQIVEDRIADQVKDQPQLAATVQKVYGIGFDQFKEMILLPRAQLEVLAIKLAEENIILHDWLTEQRKDASVFLMSMKFKWDGVEVSLR